MIKIQNKEFDYDEDEIINFAEGLIGLPEIRRAVLVSISGFEPFYWLASLGDEANRVIVVDPIGLAKDNGKPPGPDIHRSELETRFTMRVDRHRLQLNDIVPVYLKNYAGSITPCWPKDRYW